ncbi:S8 family serine peptidase [Actinoplanes sp. NPDC049265]|uniref:S8 family serine peptidase n=1 Tax=Actinoplanes sp. NPDC049265 TaxID=3363902 RepID=UPI00371BBC8B
MVKVGGRAAAVVLSLTVIAAPGFAPPAAVGAPPAQAYVLYYTVTGNETLWTIATRFLGDADRAGEILSLNSSRTQPDGARLTDPGTVHAGWNLMLPWDAIGPDLHYGVLPTEPAAPKKPVAKATPPGRAPGKTQGEARATPPAKAPGQTVSRKPDTGTRPTVQSCRPISLPDLTWGQRQLNPSQIWQWADGAGVRIAVVDSGVDATRIGLAGRVAAGADIVGGSGRGDADCLGTGTAIALFAAADDGAGGQKYGIAPKATVVPIRLVDRDAGVPAERAATAIQVAVSSGANVITLGSYVDVSDPGVRESVDNAIARNVVVVMPAARTAAGPADGLLRVGGVEQDKRTAADRPGGAVDLVGPGSAPYAAAYVAGTVALVRSNHPDLGAAEAARQVLRTATSWQQPDRYGAGLVSPSDAVSRPLPAGVRRSLDLTASGRGGDDRGDRVLGTIVLVVLIVSVVLLILVLAVRRLRSIRAARRERERATDSQDDPFTGKDGTELVGSAEKR